jgi:uncharacterized membrane protein YfhO
VPVRQGPAGLIVVDVPPGPHRLVLAWSPPGFAAGVASALLGAALALGLALARAVRRRRPGPPPAPAEQVAGVREPAASR